MAARIQGLVFAISQGKQANISTPSGNYIRMTKTNTALMRARLTRETDAAWIGKGHEFATQSFPTAWDVSGQVDKFASSEAMAIAAAYGLGSASGNVYTPLDASLGLDLPFATIVEQVPAGSTTGITNAIDRAYVGCCLEDFKYTFASGPGLRNSSVQMNWVGSGRIIEPSGVTVPSLITEHILPQSSIALVINGVDYVANANIISGEFSWKNNYLANAGFFPGSGVQNPVGGATVGAGAVRGRMEIGNRTTTLTFRARLDATSAEFAALQAGTTGTAKFSITYDAANSMTVDWDQIQYEMVDYGDSDGLVSVDVTVSPQRTIAATGTAGGPIQITVNCPISGIGQ
jgi:hypothetical protein